ncbi:hypothetical protein OF83DRAFT_869696 [Amylostereum chailletii]|nr:hypothetical protein OF83DRAFT_869696 [Amylostereum chailletii]
MRHSYQRIGNAFCAPPPLTPTSYFPPRIREGAAAASFATMRDGARTSPRRFITPRYRHPMVSPFQFHLPHPSHTHQLLCLGPCAPPPLLSENVKTGPRIRGRGRSLQATAVVLPNRAGVRDPCRLNVWSGRSFGPFLSTHDTRDSRASSSFGRLIGDPTPPRSASFGAGGARSLSVSTAVDGGMAARPESKVRARDGRAEG